jgi:hypothetical protein
MEPQPAVQSPPARKKTRWWLLSETWPKMRHGKEFNKIHLPGQQFSIYRFIECQYVYWREFNVQFTVIFFVC